MKYLYHFILIFGFLLLVCLINISRLNHKVRIIQVDQNQGSNIDSIKIDQDYQHLFKKISKLEQEIINIKVQLYLKIPPQTNQNQSNQIVSPSVNMIEISDPKWTKIDVYQKPLASSKVISQADFGIIYLYQSKQPGWYQINLDIDNLGWVQADYFKETP